MEVKKIPHITITLKPDGGADVNFDGTIQQLCYMIKFADTSLNKIVDGILPNAQPPKKEL